MLGDGGRVRVTLGTSVMVLALSPTLYALLRLALTPGVSVANYTAVYKLHAVLYFMSFFAVPAAVIRMRGEDLAVYGGYRGFAIGFITYVLFTPLFIFLFDHALGPAGDGWMKVFSFVLISLNVSAVDFFVRRVCQLPVQRIFGERAGFAAGFTSWLLVHVPESFVLLSFGLERVLFFMVATAAVFSYVYLKTEDVSGFIAGHIALNAALGVLS